MIREVLLPKGVYERTDVMKENMSLAHKGQIPSFHYPKGNIPWNKGIPISDEQKEKIRYAVVNSEKYKNYWNSYVKQTEEEAKENKRIYRRNNPDKVKRWKEADYLRTKDAYKSRARKHYQENKESILEKTKQYYQDNKEQKKKYAREYKKNNYDRIKAWNDIWRKNNKDKIMSYSENRRAKIKSPDADKITDKDIANLREKQKGLCSLCSLPMGKDCTIEHLLPLSRGGRHILGNIALAHKRCNSRKQDKTVEEYLSFLKKES